MQILGIDDEGLSLLLNRGGHTVTTASSALEGFAAIQGTRPDLIFMNMMMPNIDGAETIHQLRQAGSPRALILLSASHFGASALAALEAGANDFMAKFILRLEKLAEALPEEAVR